MPDVLSTIQRRRCMSAIRSTGSQPETIVRRLVFSLGYRYRLHVRDLPGKPDLVFPGRRAVIFVHGCFWHQHHCSDGRKPDSRQDYWLPKLRRNVERDAEHLATLVSLGWRVKVIWECDTRDQATLSAAIRLFLGPASTYDSMRTCE